MDGGAGIFEKCEIVENAAGNVEMRAAGAVKWIC